MARARYKITNPELPHFVTLTVLHSLSESMWMTRNTGDIPVPEITVGKKACWRFVRDGE